MFSKKTWILVFLPNLFLAISQALPKASQKQFEEGYLAKDQQLWIYYDHSTPHRFRGVWATAFGQQNIQGMREGSSLVFQSGQGWWKAHLSESGTGCEPLLLIHNIISQEKPIQLKANYCARRAKRNAFF